MELRLLALYPEQMNIYADRGNIVFLQRRCEWRGIGFAYAAAGPGEAFDPGAHDLIYIGGGQDRDQRAGRRRHGRDASARRSPRRSTTAPSLLAVCGGYQLLGHSYQLGEERLPGLGLADLETVREPGPRLIGNVAIEADLGDGPADDRRLREPRRPHLPRRGRAARSAGSLKGHGNNGKDGLEGVRRDNLIGTYLHGPLLPKNAWLADHLIALALERRYGTPPAARAARRRPRARRGGLAPAGPRCATECPSRRFG